MSIVSGKILVPIGFSEQSMIALDQAFNLAKIKNSKIVLLSVIEEQNMINSLFLDDNTPNLKKKVSQKLEGLADEYRKKFDVDIDFMVSKGKIYNQIHEVAEMVSADLIVMGTDGTPKGTVKKFIGSNAERVVRLSNCPVITIKGKSHRKGCDNIILPLDLDKETKEKVTYALEYARYWNATIRVVSVLFNNDEQSRRKLKSNLLQVEKFINNAGVKCTAELIEGEKKQGLGEFVFQYADSFDADLIIIMTKKEELSLSDNISVTARYIINNSNVPVMSIRPKSKEYITGPTTAF